jgi:hypothetical protein
MKTSPAPIAASKLLWWSTEHLWGKSLRPGAIVRAADEVPVKAAVGLAERRR